MNSLRHILFELISIWFHRIHENPLFLFTPSEHLLYAALYCTPFLLTPFTEDYFRLCTIGYDVVVNIYSQSWKPFLYIQREWTPQLREVRLFTSLPRAFEGICNPAKNCPFHRSRKRDGQVKYSGLQFHDWLHFTVEEIWRTDPSFWKAHTKSGQCSLPCVYRGAEQIQDWRGRNTVPFYVWGNGARSWKEWLPESDHSRVQRTGHWPLHVSNSRIFLDTVPYSLVLSVGFLNTHIMSIEYNYCSWFCCIQRYF